MLERKSFQAGKEAMTEPHFFSGICKTKRKPSEIQSRNITRVTLRKNFAPVLSVV